MKNGVDTKEFYLFWAIFFANQKQMNSFATRFPKKLMPGCLPVGRQGGNKDQTED